MICNTLFSPILDSKNPTKHNLVSDQTLVLAARAAILQDLASTLGSGRGECRNNPAGDVSDVGEEEEEDREDGEEVVVRPTNGSLSMRASEKFLHSHVNRSYTNTYSSCGSFKLPSVIGQYLPCAKN